MIQLAHIALYVQDLEGMKDFYVQHFDASASAKYHNSKTGLQTYFLSFSSGVRLELMTRPELTPHPQQDAPAAGCNHIAFALGSHERVDALAQELAQAGCLILSGPRITGDGYYEVSLQDPEGNLLELVA
jgi:lactoylglutathione lyase